jgi:hypothetical protein
MSTNGHFSVGVSLMAYAARAVNAIMPTKRIRRSMQRRHWLRG